MIDRSLPALMRRRGLLALGLVSVALGSWWVASTQPFTAGADAVTAIGIVVVLCGAIVVAIRRRRGTMALPRHDQLEKPWWPWALLAGLVTAWELVAYLFTPRVDHPTISSLYDSAASWSPAKGALFALWLALGTLLVAR
jgi:hypothetical protein